jgi:hypothetical protein
MSKPYISPPMLDGREGERRMPCTKRSHGTREAAEQHASDLVSNTSEHRALAANLQSYWCVQCQAWHVGHARQPAIKRRGKHSMRWLYGRRQEPTDGK